MGIDSKIHSQSSLQGGSKMALIEQIAAKIKQFHRNVSKVSENKDWVAVFMQMLNVLCKLAQSHIILTK